MYENKRADKWYSIVIYVDIETGEELRKYQIDSEEYKIIKTTNKYTDNGSSKIKEIYKECKNTGQLKLF